MDQAKLRFYGSALVKVTLSIDIAQKPHIMWFLGPKALNYESFEGKGKGFLDAIYWVLRRFRVSGLRVRGCAI